MDQNKDKTTAPVHPHEQPFVAPMTAALKPIKKYLPWRSSSRGADMINAAALLLNFSATGSSLPLYAQ
jgi:hypothetical protein